MSKKLIFGTCAGLSTGLLWIGANLTQNTVEGVIAFFTNVFGGGLLMAAFFVAFSDST